MHTVRAAAAVFAFVLFAVSVTAVSSEVLTRQADYTIMLQSRQFVPEVGITQQVLGEQDADSGRAKHVIIQFKDIPDALQVRALRSSGILLLDYLPNMAYFASLPAGALQDLARFPGVRAVVAIEERDKISPFIRRGGVSAHARSEDGRAEIIVTFFGDVTIEDAVRIAGMYGEISEVIEDERLLALTIPEDLIDDLASHDSVQWIEETAPPKVHMVDRVRATIGADTVQAAPYNLSGSGVALGMWEGDGPPDTHVDFTGRLYFPDGAGPGWHAARVGGIMAGDGTGSEGWGGTPYQWRGISTAADIISYTWARSLYELRAETADAISNYGIISSNNSWGWFVCAHHCSSLGSYDTWSKQYDRIVIGKQGAPINVVFSAGNDRECYGCQDSLAHFPYGTVSAPGATAKNAIGVGAVNAISKTMTPFSGWGPTHDGRVKPDLVAPGCNDTTGVMGPAPPNDYADSLCGTSWTAPVISGSLGILREQFDILGYGDVMPHTYKAIMVQTAEDLGNPGPDYEFGHGLLNLHEAVDLVIANYPANELIRPDSVADSLANTYYMDVGPGTDWFRVTLVWDDAPATVGAAKTLINDLDLVVRSPVGAPYYAYTLDPESPSAPATTGFNDVDNVEVVEVSSPDAGRWSAEVIGTLVPVGPQQYTVVLPREYPSGGIDAPDEEPSGFRLHQNRPNPFARITIVRFDLPEPARVTLRVYDVQGRSVKTLLDRRLSPAGRNIAYWDGTDDGGRPVASGIYFCRMEAAGYARTHRMVLIR